MFAKIVSFIVLMLLRLRYRIQILGLDEILKKGNKNILFLPNHPALIDPVIVTTVLLEKFHPYILVDEEQVRENILKHFVKQLRLLAIPDLGITGRAGLECVKHQFGECISALHSGNNVLMYPSGHTYRSRYESLRGNIGTKTILDQCPDIRIVLIRTTGLWGSSFSKSCGYKRSFPEILHSNFIYLLKNLIFFSPRRVVELTFQEAPADFPRNGTKEQINHRLESFYNEVAPANTYVPYTFWECGGTRIMPEPVTMENIPVHTGSVPPDVREKVYAKLKETASVSEIHDQDKLGSDLGMDSLMIYGISIWINEEFGQKVSNPENLQKVADVLLAAIGKFVQVEPLRPIPTSWFIPPDDSPKTIPENCLKVTDTFLKLASENPDFPLLADQNAGVLTNRKIVLSILALKGVFEDLPGERVGIVMPACAAFFPIFMALLFAGKTPVLLNWTVGPRNLSACVRKSGISCILSSQLVVQQLEKHGTDFSAVKDMFLYLEGLKGKITTFTKLKALFCARFCWRPLYRANVPETSAILFTSGSESEPKAVPLTHQNSMIDVAYAMAPMKLHQNDCILGMLPPFHSFGLLINVMVPALINMRTVFHSNPLEGEFLMRLIAAYGPTMIVGTPTFADGILKNADPEQVKTIRIIITGAEKCPEHVLELSRKKCPGSCFLEGYGITECGPIVALNQPDTLKWGTIGHILPCLDWKICDENGQKLPAGRTGMLWVSGPTIFNGYLAYDGPSPFVEEDGKKWYRTGDLVQIDDEGFVTFMGRLKRFIKVAGEMVSLPAVEEALLARYKGKSDQAVPLAVEAVGPDNDPEIILFTIFDVDRNEVNQVIRDAGFSSIHYVKRIVKLEEIPLLGTGKTDYRKLRNSTL